MRSTKILFVFLALIISLYSSDAFSLENVHPGFEIGINYISTIYNNPMQSWETKWRFGYTIGGILEIPISTYFGIKTGLRYLQLGNKVDFKLAENELGAEYSGDFKIIQNYVSLPILLKISTASEPRFFFQFGPEFGSLISARAKYSEKMFIQSLGHDIQSDRKEDITNSIKPYNVCLNAGLGITLKVLSQLLNVQIEYGHGMVGTAKREHWISNWETREMRMTLGYFF